MYLKSCDTLTENEIHAGENRKMNCLSAVTPLITRTDQRYKCHGYTHVRCAHHYVFREKGHWWPVLVCWYNRDKPKAMASGFLCITGSRTQQVLIINEWTLGRINSFLSKPPGVGVCCFRGCPAAFDTAKALCRLGKAGRQCVPFLRYSPGNAKEEAVTLETAAALPGTRAS